MADTTAFTLATGLCFFGFVAIATGLFYFLSIKPLSIGWWFHRTEQTLARWFHRSWRDEIISGGFHPWWFHRNWQPVDGDPFRSMFAGRTQALFLLQFPQEGLRVADVDVHLRGEALGADIDTLARGARMERENDLGQPGSGFGVIGGEDGFQ